MIRTFDLENLEPINALFAKTRPNKLLQSMVSKLTLEQPMVA